MRKSLFTLALFSAFASSPALAEDQKFYGGVDYTYSRFSYEDSTLTPGIGFSDVVADNFNGFAPHVGYQFNKNFAFELGYSGMLSESESKTSGATTISSDTEYWSVYGDLIGMYPINPRVSLLGSLGYERINVDIDSTTKSGASTFHNSAKNDVDAARIGLGAEYMLTPDISLRGMVRYVATDFSGIDNYIQGSVGLNYYFN